ncbi:ABC transporter permease [bacterium]|nr:ABC transporter permease [bacterium]
MLKIEWLKLKRYKPFWILMTIYPASLFGLLFLISRTIDRQASLNPAIHNAVDKITAFRYPEVWTTVTWTASWFHFLPCVLILLNVCNEFESRTHRQNLLDGWSRAQFFLAKVMVTLGVTLVSVFWVALLATLLAATHSSPPSLEGADRLLYFFEQCLIYNFFALALGFLVRRGIVSLAIFLVYSVSLEFVVFGFLSFFLRHVEYYAPLRLANQLLPLPLWKDVAKRISPDAPGMEVLQAFALGYLVLFIGLSWWRYHRSDL